MKAFLMYPDRDLDLGRDLPANEPDLSRDLELDVLLSAMADGDEFLFRVARQGLAQLMTQAGMFAAAESFTASASTGIFTHFKREEDATMEKGKLDEELARMAAIASHIPGGALLLCNESFASTNEREGSEIARQIIRAMTEAGIRVVFVTHMYDLAGGYYAEQDPGALFLRAERQPDGHRTFRLLVREPLPTSFGEDVYREVFGTADQPARI